MRCVRGPAIPLALATLAGSLEAQAVPRWRLSVPHFEIGGVDAAGEYTLTELGGVSVLPNGNIVVGDRAAPFLKVFSPEGDFLRAEGSFGEGPGEYEYVYEMDWCAPGELSVFDVDRRVHRYTGDLDFISTDLESVEAIGGGVPYNRDCHPNGFQIVTGWGDFRGQFKPGLYEATAPVLLLRGQDEVVRDFGERLSSQRVGLLGPAGSPAGSGPHPFGRATVVALGGSRVYIGDGADYAVEVYDLKGRALPTIRWSGPSLEYDQRLIDALVDRAVAEAPERSRPAIRRRYSDMPKLDQLPAYERLLVSDSDELWVRQFVKPGSLGEEWTVIGERGQVCGTLMLPPRSTLWEVRGDRVVYSKLDDFDVPIVRISMLEKWGRVGGCCLTCACC